MYKMLKLIMACLLAVTISSLLNQNSLKAQELDTVKFTGEFKQAPLLQVLTSINEQTGIRIYYQDTWLADYTYTGTFKETSVLSVFNKVLERTDLVSVVIEQNIYVVPREQVSVILKKVSNLGGYNQEDFEKTYRVIGNIKESGKYAEVKITGVVRDGGNGEPVIGARIVVLNTDKYAISGYTGGYVLKLPSGIYQLKVSSMGYEEKLIDIKAYGPGELDIELFDESHALGEVVITGEKVNQNVTRDQMSVLEMNAKSIKQLPSSIGERDIIKAFATMPGVKTAGEFGSGINVRGGGEDQNLYLLEGAPVFNTSHVMGLLSVVNPDAVNKVNLYKGHIPIQYGERVSSVMDIGILNPTIDKLVLKGGIGIYSSRLQIETPLGSKKVTLKLGARSSYSDYLLTLMPDYYLQNSSASFYDVTGVLNFNLKNNPITIFGYTSSDYFKYANDFKYNYGNQLLSVGWTHIFNPNLTANLTGAYSSYGLDHYNYQVKNEENQIYSRIQYKSAKMAFEYLGLSNQEIDFGGQVIGYGINPGEQTPIDGSNATTETIEPETGYEYSVFASDGISIGPRFSFQIGLRYTHYNYVGPRTIYQYEEGQPVIPANVTDSTVYGSGDKIVSYSGFEPRASAKYMLTDNSSLKLSYNRNRQYISLLSYTSITTPEDVWKLADPYIKPILADQLALGYYLNLNDNMFETSVELYYKKLENLTEYRNGAQIKMNNHVETELLSATGDNYGIEFLIKKNEGKLNGSLSYTFARAFKQTNGTNYLDMINQNEKYPSQYDVPHNVNLALNYKFNRRIRFGVNFTYSTGRPVTLPEYVYYLNRDALVYYSPRNKYRLPDYHRLDLSMSIDESLRKSKRWKGSWTFAILNVYGRENAYSVFYKKDTPSEANNYQVFSLSKMYLIGVPMPTITYNFIF